MRNFIVASAVVFSAAIAAAQETTIRFDPPAPVAGQPTTVIIAGLSGTGCPPQNPVVSVAGFDITISLSVSAHPCPILPIRPVEWREVATIPALRAGVYRVRALVPQVLGTEPLAEATLTVRDPNPRFTITPNVVVGSGDVVRLRGRDIAACDDTAACAPPVVRFGDTVAEIVEIRPRDEYLVRVPTRPPGTVDVTITRGNEILRASSAFHYAEANGRADLAFFEPVLFPVLSGGPGAFGAIWQTDVAMRNDAGFQFVTPGERLFEECAACDVTATSTRSFSQPAYPSGFVLHMPRNNARDFHFGTLVRDLSRQSEALGTEIPVVRESELFDRRFEILDVPTDSRFRVTLRVYSVGSVGQPLIIIRGQNDPVTVEPLVAISVRLTDSPRQPGVVANFTVADLVTAYPQLSNKGPLRIEIAPFDKTDALLWGFVSVTNNATQHVTVLTPQ